MLEMQFQSTLSNIFCQEHSPLRDAGKISEMHINLPATKMASCPAVGALYERFFEKAVLLCVMMFSGENVFSAGGCYQWNQGPGPWLNFPQAVAQELVDYCNSPAGPYEAGNATACTTLSQLTCGLYGYHCVASVKSVQVATWPQHLITVQVDRTQDGSSITGHWERPLLTNSRQNPSGCYYIAPFPKAILPAENGSCKLGEPAKSFCGDPVNPANGNTYKSEADFIGTGKVRFSRYYNSASVDQSGINGGWRGSYSRSVLANATIAAYQPLSVAGSGASSLFANESLACTGGFAQIKSQVPNWSLAVASFSNGVCNLTQAGTSIGVLPIFNAFWSSLAEASPPSFDYISDDGQVVNFSVINAAVTAPPGSSLKLAQIASGFTLTDSNDDVETYDTSGKLLSITSRAGVVQTMIYDGSGRLSSVVDSFGHQVTLGYDTQNQLISVTRQ